MAQAQKRGPLGKLRPTPPAFARLAAKRNPRHRAVELVFRALSEGDLYRRFRKQNDAPSASGSDRPESKKDGLSWLRDARPRVSAVVWGATPRKWRRGWARMLAA